MTLLDLYLRDIGTTGLDVMDLNSLKAAVSNCMADLTSRGYKVFNEKLLLTNDDNEKLEIIEQKNGYVELKAPKDIRKIVYVKVFFEQDADMATRLSLSNPRVQCKYDVEQKIFRSVLERSQTIFYVKNDKIYIEWDTDMRNNLCQIAFGYYQKLYCPDNFPTDPNDAKDMQKVNIDIRPEFEDALVFYAAYFYTARYIKDTDKINLYLSNYKYYVEDIVHELSYEDDFNEEDAIIKTEED